MCGIAGYLGYRPTVGELTQTLVNLSIRGHDATGIAWQDKKGWHLVKGVVPAPDFIQEKGSVLEHVVNEPTTTGILLHTRLASHGSPGEINNAHPIANAAKLIIHNGCVYPTTQYSEARGETDTEQFLLDIHYRGLFTSLKTVPGWYAIAYVDAEAPNKVLLARRNAPISLFRHRDGGYAFASTQNLLATTKNMKGLTFEDDTRRWVNLETKTISDAEEIRSKNNRRPFVQWYVNDHIYTTYGTKAALRPGNVAGGGWRVC